MDIHAFSIMDRKSTTSAQFTGTFGPQRSQYRPDMPFWRLQGDGFWQLHNAEALLNSREQPTTASEGTERIPTLQAVSMNSTTPW